MEQHATFGSKSYQEPFKSPPKPERWHRIFWSRLKRSSQSARCLRFFCFSVVSAFSGFLFLSFFSFLLVSGFFSFLVVSCLSRLAPGADVSSSSDFFSKNFFRFLQPSKVVLNLVSWAHVRNWSTVNAIINGFDSHLNELRLILLRWRWRSWSWLQLQQLWSTWWRHPAMLNQML